MNAHDTPAAAVGQTARASLTAAELKTLERLQFLWATHKATKTQILRCMELEARNRRAIMNAYSPSIEAERNYTRREQEALEVRDAAASLAAELADAMRTNPAHAVHTPAWGQKHTPAHEVLACELGTHSLAVSEFLRDAAAGKSVWLQAQVLTELVCTTHGNTHAEDAV